MMTLREAWRRYHLRSDHSERYVQDVSCCLAHWERCSGDPPICQIDNETMLAFRERFLLTPLPSTGRPPSPASFNKVRRTLLAILATLGPPERGNPYGLALLERVPSVRPVREEEPQPVVASLEEVSAIYQACRHARWPAMPKTGIPPADLWRALVVFLFNVGARRNDFLSLCWSDVDLGERIVYLRQHKTGKLRPLPLHRLVIEHLEPIRWPHRPRVFCFPRNTGLLYQQWHAIQRAAGIMVRWQDARRKPVYGFHELRKTCLTEYAMQSETAAQQMGAHGSIETTRRYYVAKQGLLRQACERISQPHAFLFDGDDDPPPHGTPTGCQDGALRVVG